MEKDIRNKVLSLLEGDARLTKENIAVMLDNTNKFAKQNLPYGIIGICEDTNINALEIFYKNNISV
ncbi:MAG: hypothetical protein IJ939_01740, partial [Clostridia bacterium]|nr:hypothetical protein [Clostridia bacterium]